MNEFKVGDKVWFPRSPMNKDLIYTIEEFNEQGVSVGIDLPTPSGSTYHYSYQLTNPEWNMVLKPEKVET